VDGRRVKPEPRRVRGRPDSCLMPGLASCLRRPPHKATPVLEELAAIAEPPPDLLALQRKLASGYFALTGADRGRARIREKND
jgi:hypothetical protein